MTKLLLVSILIDSIVIPYTSALESNPQVALRKLLTRSACFMIAYGLLLRFVFPRLL